MNYLLIAIWDRYIWSASMVIQVVQSFNVVIFETRPIAECLRVLLEKCPDSIFVLNDNGDSALHISALKNKADSCKVLLEKYPELSLWQNKVCLL